MAAPLRFYTSEFLTATSKRAYTPEGFLLCQDVPIARIGTLLYGRGEIPVAPNADGLIRITRDPEDVFHPNAILSFAGKPVTDEHPPQRVTPDNWKMHSIGVVLNPHQGDGRTENDSLLYADLLIQDRVAIKDVMDGKREVSAGYDAEYEQVQPGEGKQHNIIGNHVALVERGRCGPICSIGDSAMAKHRVSVTRTTPAQRRAKMTRDRIMAAFMTGDEDGLVDELDKVDEMLGSTAEGDLSEVGSIGYHKSGGGGGDTSDEFGSGTHVHIHAGGGTAMDEPKPPVPGAPPPAAGAPPPAAGAPPPDGGAGGVTLEQLAARIDRIEQAIAILAQGEGQPDETPPDENSPGMDNPDEKKPPTGDRVTGDSAALVISFQEVLARAELLVPGIRRPTFDSMKPRAQTIQGMCDFRRQTLATALDANQEPADAIKAVAGTPKNPPEYIRALSCDAVSAVFNGASEMIRTSGMRAHSGTPAPSGKQFGSGTVTPTQTVLDVVAGMNEKNRAFYEKSKGQYR